MLVARLFEADVRRLDVHERVVAGEDRRQARLGLRTGQAARVRTGALRLHAAQAPARLTAVRELELGVEHRAAPAVADLDVTGSVHAGHGLILRGPGPGR
jgi:hypothetical protein